MSIRATPILLAAAGLAAATAAPAQTLMPLTETGDAARGETLAYTCTGCHGIDSSVNAYPSYHVPKLGGQNADYLEIALQGYRNGSRSHDTMHGQAAQLSDQDIADVAAYFASIEGEAATGTLSAGSAAIAAGHPAVHIAADKDGIARTIRALLDHGDVVLLKASRALELETVLDELKEDA